MRPHDASRRHAACLARGIRHESSFILTSLLVLYEFIFGGLWRPAIAWVGVQFVLIALWSWRRSGRCARAVWGGFAVLPLLLVVSSLLVTDRERIILLCEQLAEDVEAHDVAAIDRRLAEDFRIDGHDRTEFLDRLEGTLSRYRVWDVKLRSFQVSFPRPDVATATFHATARVRSEDLLYEWIAASWKLTFVRRGESWLVTGIARERDHNPFQLGDLLR